MAEGKIIRQVSLQHPEAYGRGIKKSRIGMRSRIVLIGALALVISVLIGAFFHWRASGPVRRKYEAPRKRAAARLPEEKKEALPAVTKKVKRPKAAIVMDDFGYNKNNLEEFFEIGEPITLSILPNLRYSSEIAEEAVSRGREVVLHLPLEAHGENVREEADTIESGMSDKEVLAKLDKDIASVPVSSGVSSHMGSKATENKALMAVIFKHLKKHGLYFFDSLTSQRSVCRKVAAAEGLRYAQRDVFLDNLDDKGYIKKQLLELRALAFRKGRATAVCHDRKNTIEVLGVMMPEMAKDGIDFVFLSELVE